MAPESSLFAPLHTVGSAMLNVLNEAGRVSLFVANVARSPFSCAKQGRGQFIQQCAAVGVDSLPIVLLTALFTGAVLALHSFYGLNGGPLVNTQVGRLVSLSIVRELGPVLAGLMLASRVGAAMAAELGTMKVTEQLDALYTLATNPLRHLALPRMLACLTMLPLLVVLGNLMGIYGGYLVGVQSLGIPHNLYLEGTFDALKSEDLIMSFTKAAVFGLLVGIWGTYHGFSATGGARGVGVATTRAVVYASASILTADYFVTALFV